MLNVMSPPIEWDQGSVTNHQSAAYYKWLCMLGILSRSVPSRFHWKRAHYVACQHWHFLITSVNYIVFCRIIWESWKGKTPSKSAGLRCSAAGSSLRTSVTTCPITTWPEFNGLCSSWYEWLSTCSCWTSVTTWSLATWPEFSGLYSSWCEWLSTSRCCCRNASTWYDDDSTTLSSWE